MKETMNPISAVVAAALGVLSAYMVQLFIPLIVLVIAMVVDYGTGMAKAWSAGELCSRTGIKGIIKKVGYLVIVLVAMGADYLLRYGMEQVGIHINVDFLIAAIVIAWLIINELISILENVAAIGAPAPRGSSCTTQRPRPARRSRSTAGTWPTAGWASGTTSLSVRTAPSIGAVRRTQWAPTPATTTTTASACASRATT